MRVSIVRWARLEGQLTGETVGDIVRADHEGIEAGEDGANGKEVVPLVLDRHREDEGRLGAGGRSGLFS